MNKMQEILADEDLAKVYPDRFGLIREVHNFLFFGILPVPGKNE